MEFGTFDWNNLPEPLSTEELDELFSKMESCNKEERNKISKKIVYHNLRLIIYLIKKKFSYVNCDREELISLGLEILYNAVNTYDIKKNVKFSTYAYRCMKNRMLNYLRDLKVEEKICSLNVLCHHDDMYDDGIELIDLISDKIDIQEEYINSLDRENFFGAINSLPLRYKKIIILYCYKHYSQSEIAEKFGVTRQCITKNLKKAIEYLKKLLIENDVLSESCCK